MTKQIYKTFEQWMDGNFLEVKEPRKKAYSKDELLLVEMGWKYGYDAGRAVEQALDKKAENARELGLDYEPSAKVRDFWEGYVPEPQYSVNCVNHDCDKCKAAAQPAPVQEPVATVKVLPLGDGHKPMYWADWADADNPPPENTLLYTTPPAAQRTWVGLTDEERDDLLDNYITAEGRARAIEAKLREKNT